MTRIKDLTGQKFGRLTIISFAYVRKNHTYWLCRCDCGNEIIAESYNIKRGNTNSCGCYFREVTKISNTKHGLSDTKFHNSWFSMKARCTNPNNEDYHNYGARNIKICKEWLVDFINFKNDMYESYLEHVDRYGEAQTSLDRIDVNKDYCKENCRWATWKIQGENRRSNKNFKATSPSGEVFVSKNKREFSKTCGFCATYISKILKKEMNSYNGWTMEFIDTDEL